MSIYNSLLLSFALNFVTGNVRWKPSSSNTISKLQLTDGSSVCHSDAMKRHKHACGKRCSSNAPLFMAPHTPLGLTPH